MNIFVLDSNPKLTAQYHNDKHVVKMILESSQMLCTAVNYYANEQVAPYRSTHLNHPCSIWVRESYVNFVWLYVLMSCLNTEYRYRYGHSDNHLSFNKMVAVDLLNLAKKVYPISKQQIGLTSFALAMPDSCKIQNDPIGSYRKYYIGNKSHLAKWTKRGAPEWYAAH